MTRQCFGALAVWAAASVMAVGQGTRQQQPAPLKRPAITGIAFTRFYTSDPAAAKVFYGERLGLPETGGPGGMMVFAVGPRQKIEVVPQPTPVPESRLAEIGFFTPDVPAMKVFLERHGLQVEDEGKGIRTTDPEGNEIGFVPEAGKAAAAKLAVMVPTDKPGSSTSGRIIHAGFQVQDREAEDSFYIKLLGFRPYWYGGMVDGRTDWVSLQVPDGTDWVEYMLNSAKDAPTRGVMNHVSLGEVHIEDATKQLEANGWADAQTRKVQMGRDGKMQMNLYDPDHTRVEVMEFQPREKPCCSEYTASNPTGEME